MQGRSTDAAVRLSSFRGRLARGTTLVVDRRQDYAATPHTHDCDMLFVPVSGRFDVVDASEHRLHSAPGSFIWFAAGTVHATTAQTSRQAHLALYVDPDLWSTLLRAQGIGNAPLGVRSGSPAISLLSHKLLQMSDLQGQPDPAACCGALLMEAARLCAHPLLPESGADARWMAELLADHIERDLSQPLDIDALARRHGHSRRQLERLFRQETGTSPLAYQQARRLERARYLLQQTGDSVLSIALQVGWESTSYLNRMLRREWGCTASQVRGERVGLGRQG